VPPAPVEPPTLTVPPVPVEPPEPPVPVEPPLLTLPPVPVEDDPPVPVEPPLLTPPAPVEDDPPVPVEPPLLTPPVPVEDDPQVPVDPPLPGAPPWPVVTVGALLAQAATARKRAVEDARRVDFMMGASGRSKSKIKFRKFEGIVGPRRRVFQPETGDCRGRYQACASK
jgi:hypothetical protein